MPTTPPFIRSLVRLGVALVLGGAIACRADEAVDPNSPNARPSVYNRDWTAASHGNDVPPNYGVVFPQDAVNSLEITMTPEAWSKVRANMVSLLGVDFGARGQGGGFPPPDPDYIDVTLEYNGKVWKNVG